LALSLLAGAQLQPRQQPQPRERRILVLLPFEGVRPASASLLAGIRETLGRRLPNQTAVFLENFRPSPPFRADFEQRRLDWLSYRYGAMEIDAICTVRPEGLGLARTLRDRLWPSAPIIFGLLNEDPRPELKPGSNMTGIVLDSGEVETIQAALKMLPDTRRVAVVGGAMANDAAQNARLMAAIRRNRPNLEILPLIGLTMGDLKARVGQLPPKTILYLGQTSFDGTGRRLTIPEIASELAPLTNSPMFCSQDLAFGYGIVGGPMSSVKRGGEAMGDLVAKVLKGQPAESLPVAALAHRSAVDWRELKRWGIPENRLPPGTWIENKKSSVWEEYGWQIGLGFCVVLLQASIIGVLLAQRRRRIASERQARESARLNRAILSSISGRIAMLDAAGMVVSVDEDWGQVVNGEEGFPEYATGASYLEAIESWKPLAEGREQVRAAVEAVLGKGERTRSAEFRYQSGERERWVGVRVERLERGDGGAVVIHRDITNEKQAQLERRRALEELYHVNRVATVGQLAGSLAHELAQPLASIMSNAQAGARFLDRPGGAELGEVREALAQVVEDDRRARKIIDRMRAILKKQAIPVHEVNLNRCVEDVVRLAGNMAQVRGVQLQLGLAKEDVVVMGDDVPLQQVVLNLLNNAMDAVAGQPRGARFVRIRTLREGDVGEVVVEDSGPGIPEEVLGRLYDSFFTTKPDGLGMGLSICRSIVESVGGGISARNRPEGGAQFRVAFPVVARTEAGPSVATRD
jgi:signal transduction histidine kinase